VVDILLQPFYAKWSATNCPGDSLPPSVADVYNHLRKECSLKPSVANGVLPTA
jgi:hypothetical protein